MAAEKQALDERLRSLKIDRGRPAPGNGRRTWIAVAVTAAAFLLVGGAAYYAMSGPVKVSVVEARVAGAGPAAGQSVLSASGYVVAAHKIAVGAKVMGRVAWIGVEKGDRVERGQLLVRLEDAEYQAQVGQARANVAAAQAKLDQLRAGSRPQEKGQGRAAVAQAEATLRNAEREHARLVSLFESGVTSRAELDRAAAQLDVARAQLESARQSSELTEIGPRAEEVRGAEAAVLQAKAALDYALTQLESTRITAPVTGTILERIVETGEMVTPSAFGESGARTSVVSLADLGDLQVELDISQTDFARLSMGQRAEIIPEAYPSLRYGGFIEEIAPEANRAKATVQVKVKVESPDAQLRPEMNARVNFLAAAEPRAEPSSNGATAVLIPQSAVVRRDGGDFVFVIKNGTVEMRSVRVGETAGEDVAILDGITRGDRVVVRGAEALDDGDRVEVTP